MSAEVAQKVAQLQKKMDEDVAEIKRIENGKRLPAHSSRVPQGHPEQGLDDGQEGRERGSHGGVQDA